MFNLFPVLLFDADGAGAGGGGTGDSATNGPPTDPPEPGDPLQDLRKQVEGVESLLGSHKKEFGDMRTEFKTNTDLLNNVLSQLQGGAAPGDPAPVPDDSYNFMTKADVDAQLAANTQQILEALTKGSQQNDVATKYNLDKDAMIELDAFAQKNNIGSNLEAAHLLKLKNEGKLNPQGGATPNEIVKDMANRNGADVIPEAGGGQDPFEDPFKWLSTPKDSPDYYNNIRRFQDWRKANPKEYERLMREKTIAAPRAA